MSANSANTLSMREVRACLCKKAVTSNVFEIHFFHPSVDQAGPDAPCNAAPDLEY